MQTGGCDVSGEFMALRKEKQTDSTASSLDPGTALCLLSTVDQLTNPKSVETKSNYVFFLSFVLQVSTPSAGMCRLWLSSSELVIDM